MYNSCVYSAIALDVEHDESIVSGSQPWIYWQFCVASFPSTTVLRGYAECKYVASIRLSMTSEGQISSQVYTKHLLRCC